MTETLKLLKRYALASMLLLCVVAMLCGGAVVSSNTRQLAMGERGRQVGFSFDQETTTILAGQSVFVWPPLPAAMRWLRCAPAPFGTLTAVGQSIYALLPPLMGMR